MCCSSSSWTGSFDVVNINTGNGWSQKSNGFIAPITGIYYFSFSFGANASKAVWGNIYVGTYTFCDNRGPGILNTELYSRGCLIHVEAGVIVRAMTRSENSTVYNSTYNEASFKGFLYSPVQELSVAWSVHYNSSFNGFTGTVQFPLVLVNSRNVWSTMGNNVTIPIAGTYYIELVAEVNGYLDMQLKLNGVKLLSRIWFTFNEPTAFITRSRSLLIKCDVNDILSVTCSSCRISGASYGGISFQGIFLFST